MSNESDLPVWTDEVSFETEKAFVQRLIEAIPELSSFFNRHVEVNGEILPYVFIGDLRNLLCEWIGQNTQNDYRIVRLLNFLETEFVSNDQSVNELICVGFLEYLETFGDCGELLVNMLPTKLHSVKLRCM